MFFDLLNRSSISSKSKTGPKKKNQNLPILCPFLSQNTVAFEIILTFKLIMLFFGLYYMFFDLLNLFSIPLKSKSGPKTKKSQNLAILWPFFALKCRFFEIIVTFKLITLFFRLYYKITFLI